MNYLVTYLQRLKGDDLRRVKEDMATLAAFAKSEKWPKQQVRFLQDFLSENGINELNGGAGSVMTASVPPDVKQRTLPARTTGHSLETLSP